MATVIIHYDCGCGFHGKTVEEATEHADRLKHTINVAGMIISSERKVRTSISSSHTPSLPRLRTVKPVLDAAPIEVQADDNVGFSNLRARLQRK